jgi:hypothetical protein
MSHQGEGCLIIMSNVDPKASKGCLCSLLSGVYSLSALGPSADRFDSTGCCIYKEFPCRNRIYRGRLSVNIGTSHVILLVSDSTLVKLLLDGFWSCWS